ncbi:hypothetical protein N7488_002535 [Penicillium malachiteum]|nr:hypothetical protein N7488_002535 [Penicillium malachiteum]
MQLKFSIFSTILADSTSVLAAPTGLLSPGSAINAIHALDIETNQLHYRINSTMDSQNYMDAISRGLQSLIKEKIKDNAEYSLEGITEGTDSEEDPLLGIHRLRILMVYIKDLLNGLKEYVPSCSGEMLPYIEKQRAAQNGAEATYSFSSGGFLQ